MAELVRTYYPSGQLEEEYSVSNNKKNGIYRKYDDKNNIVMSNTIYIMLILTSVVSIITSTMFIVGLVSGFLL